jgi:hypothetical protein
MANYFLLKSAQFAGWASGVEKNLDTYKDYYLTSAELVNPRNVDPEQLKLLNSDPRFKDQKAYLVTAVQPQASGNLKQRRFMLSENDARKMGLPDIKEGQKIGGKNTVIVDKKFTFETLGQYLEEMDLGVGKMSVAKIYPRVQNVTSEPVAAGEAVKINEALTNKNPSTGFDWHFQSHPKPANRLRPPSPN